MLVHRIPCEYSVHGKSSPSYCIVIVIPSTDRCKPRLFTLQSKKEVINYRIRRCINVAKDDWDYNDTRIIFVCAMKGVVHSIVIKAGCLYRTQQSMLGEAGKSGMTSWRHLCYLLSLWRTRSTISRLLFFNVVICFFFNLIGKIM